MNYFSSEHKLDSYFDYYSDDDEDYFNLEFMKALYPILEYTYDSEEVSLTPKRVSHEWFFDKMFSSDHEAFAAVDSEETWRPHSRTDTPEGRPLKVVYRCTQVPRDGPQCAAKVYLLYHQATSSIMLYRTLAKHDHLSILESLEKNGIKKEKRKKRLRQQSIMETFGIRK